MEYKRVEEKRKKKLKETVVIIHVYMYLKTIFQISRKTVGELNINELS